MPTRTRTRTRPADSQDAETEFDPTAVRTIEHEDGDDTPDEAYQNELPLDPVDDGSQDNEPDPSAGQPLGRTRAGMTQGQQAAQAELRSYIQRMANLEAEKRTIAEDIRELAKEIKGKGYDAKAFKLVFKLSEMSDGELDKLRDQKAVNQTYARSVGLDEDLV